MIRRAVYADVNRLAEIHVYGWRCAYRGIVSDRYLFNKMCVAKRVEGFKKSLLDETEETYVFDHDGIIKGFMTIGSCRDEDRKEAFELWGIYMEPCFKKLGIGRRLVAYCEDVAKIRGHGEILLWVLEGNLDSRAFYEKCGYRPEGTVKTLENLGVNEIRYIKKI